MNAHKPIKLLLGGAHLDGNAKALHHLSSVGPKEVEANHTLVLCVEGINDTKKV